MSEKAASWQFAERYQTEPEEIRNARAAAADWGLASVSPALGTHLAVLAAAVGSKNIAEIGTGAGVSGLSLLRGAPTAMLTTIEIEPDYWNAAKRAFRLAGYPGHQTRAILGDALDVLQRLADGGYDLVFIDAEPERVSEYVAQALRIVRPGGLIAVAHALNGDRVADPVARDEATTAYRTLLGELSERSAVLSSLVTADDGLLTIVRP
jgi:predicted O-methyltransferase YrrM